MRSVIHHRPMRSFAPAGAILAVTLLAATPLPLPDPHASAPRASWGASMHHAVAAFDTEAEHTIIIGGIILERNRHLAVGSAIGCSIGASLGAGAGAALGLVTAGIGFAAVPAASAVGCGALGVAGAAFGSTLDAYQMDLSDLEDDSH